MVHYQVCRDLEISLPQFDWRTLPVTSQANRRQVLQRIVQSKDNWVDYFAFYGWLLRRVGVVKNLQLPADLEQTIAQRVQSYFESYEVPIIRLQVIYGGSLVPLHTDITRHASLVIPVSNHGSARTNFYEAMRRVDPALPNPMQCMCIESTVISVPTLIDTDCIHAVVYSEPITEHNPRISITAKWPNTRFKDLI